MIRPANKVLLVLFASLFFIFSYVDMRRVVGTNPTLNFHFCETSDVKSKKTVQLRLFLNTEKKKL